MEPGEKKDRKEKKSWKLHERQMGEWWKEGVYWRSEEEWWALL